jgi:hypothetical protein
MVCPLVRAYDVHSGGALSAVHSDENIQKIIETVGEDAKEIT